MEKKSIGFDIVKILIGILFVLPIILGAIITIIGLTIFLVASNVGFLNMGLNIPLAHLEFFVFIDF